VPVGPYIVDFINHEWGFVVEVDGATHGDTDEVARDERRTAFLESKGLQVHRVGNADVYQNIVDVCDGILIVLQERAARDLISRSATASPEEKREV
jgi:very-short-patch-repair endonuclease